MQRRQLLKSAVAATALFSIVPRHVLGGPKFVPPSDKIHLAIVGAGGRGRQVLKQMIEEPDVLALAVADPAKSFSLQNFYYKDVGGREPTRELLEKHYREKDKNYRCAMYENFEEMLDAEHDLDAILCGTPDHLHAYVSTKAMKAGKHVYCEKPLTHNIWEARVVSEMAKKTGLATQMGNQGHSTDGMRETCEWIWSGAIGPVRQVHAWVNGNRWNPTLSGKPETNTPVPDGLNWNLWQGPREPRAFEPAYFPVAWRDFWAYGNSNIGDFACHDLDAACWALDLKNPTVVDFSHAGVCNSEIGPHGCIGRYQFEANGNRPAVSVTWYDGGLKPELPKGWPANAPLPGRGIFFIGDDGVLFCGGAGGPPKLLPESRMAEFQKPDKKLERVSSHHRNWLDACKGGSPAGSNFEYGANLTELALLGALSLRTQKRIEWDAEKMVAKGVPEADQIIKEGYRSGWELPT
jgi:predicted dehydrogenase